MTQHTDPPVMEQTGNAKVENVKNGEGGKVFRGTEIREENRLRGYEHSREIYCLFGVSDREEQREKENIL